MHRILLMLWALKQTILSIGKILLRSKFLVKIPVTANTSESNIIVLGNGPSLNQTIEKYEDILLNTDLMCVNAFSLSDEYQKLKPKYYTIADPQFWKSNPIKGMDDFCLNVVNAIIEKTNWELTLFTPFDSAKFPILEKFKTNPNIKIIFYNKTTIYGFDWFRNYCYKKNIGIPRPQNVIIPSIMLSINMGYSNIYITGADHSWLETLVIDDNNILCIRDDHFYDKEKPNLRPIKDIFTGKGLHLHEQLKALSMIFEIYFVIENYAQHRKASIFNASEKTFIDAFKRKKLDTLK